MKKFDFKTILPHIIAVVVFIIVAAVYCKPALEGKVLEQHDIIGWEGMARQSVVFNEEHGFFPLWTNSMFSGMPAYQIYLDGGSNITVFHLQKLFTLGLPKPLNFFFLACIAFYFLCVVAGANPWLGILGGISYAYSTFDPIIVAVGHDTQMMSIGYAPAVLAGLLLLFKQRYWTGFAITTIFASLMLMQNHVQVVYYLLIVAFIMFVAFLIKCIQEKQTAIAIKAGLLGATAGLIGLGTTAVTMFPTYDYASESMRGGRSELTLGDTSVKTKGGLDKDYAFRYSLGFGETFTFMIPALYGGGNGSDEFRSADTRFAEQFSALGVPPEQALQYQNAYAYWGEQPGTSGPVYLGAVICLLFIFGVIYLRGWVRWWLLASSAFGLILAYGYHLSSVNYLLFDYLPFYNKFRAPTMALIIPQLCFPLMGILALHKLTLRNPQEEVLKKLKVTGIVAGVLIALMGLFYMNASFEGPNDKMLQQNFTQSFLQQVPPGQEVPAQMQQQAEQTSSSLINALQQDRRSHMGGDLLRSTILMALALVMLWLYVRRKLTEAVVFGGLILLSGFDLLGIATRYLNAGKYVDEHEYDAAFLPSAADQQILSDPDHKNFRVFNQTVDPFNDASTSYHHNSVGGYHPAKLALYQDLISHQLAKGNMEVYNMLNTKYFIVQDPQTGRPAAQLNPGAFGNAWLVDGVKIVPGPNEEMLALDNTDLRDTVVVEEKYKNQIRSDIQRDSAASIRLLSNMNDRITYEFESASPQVAVFSEVYYPRGWHAYVDGNKSDFFRANYALRGMYLPAGSHKVEFRFEPASYYTGRTVSIISSILAFLILLGAVFFAWRKKENATAFALNDL